MRLTKIKLAFIFFFGKMREKGGVKKTIMMVAGPIGMIAAAAALTILALEHGQDYIERRKKWHTEKP